MGTGVTRIEGEPYGFGAPIAPPFIIDPCFLWCLPMRWFEPSIIPGEAIASGDPIDPIEPLLPDIDSRFAACKPIDVAWLMQTNLPCLVLPYRGVPGMWKTFVWVLAHTTLSPAAHDGIAIFEPIIELRAKAGVAKVALKMTAAAAATV